MNIPMIATIFAVFAIQSMTLGSEEVHRWSADAPNVRTRFVEAIQQVQDQFSDSPSTMAEVRTILGEPDDILLEEDDSSWPGHVTWCYGTSRHLSLPTLGTVLFNESGKTRWIKGAQSLALNANLPPEARLRELLQLIDRLHCDITAPRYNPRDMVVVVNTLRELGKNQALSVLREYSRVQSVMQYEGGGAAIVVMRFLFSVADGEVHHTTYLPFEEYKSADYPAIPAVVFDGVPLYLFPLGGWGMGGGVPPADIYLDWYAQHGTIIEQPLRPVDAPRSIWDTWQQGLRPIIHAADEALAVAADDLIRLQLLKMIDTVHPRDFSESEWWGEKKTKLWSEAMAALEATPCRWDELAGRYVRAEDGSFIDPPGPVEYVRVLWKLPVEGRHVRLILHRKSDETVYMNLYQVVNNAPVIPNMTVAVRAATDDDGEITSFDLDGGFTSGSSARAHQLLVAKGTKLRAQLIHDNKVIAESNLLDVDRETQRAN